MVKTIIDWKLLRKRVKGKPSLSAFFKNFYKSVVQCYIHKDLPIISILSRINLIPLINTDFFKIHSNIYLFIYLHGFPHGRSMRAAV